MISSLLGNSSPSIHHAAAVRELKDSSTSDSSFLGSSSKTPLPTSTVVASAAPSKSAATEGTRPPPVRPIEEFDIDDEIQGLGCTSEIRFGKDRIHHREYALKFMPKSVADLKGFIPPEGHFKEYTICTQDEILQEITVAQALDHPNLIKIECYTQTPTHHVIVMEKAEGIELFAYIKQEKGRLRASTIRNMAIQLVSGLSHMKERGIIHRDIKLENILFESKTQRVKLIDFGFARFVEEGTRPSTPRGTIDYFTRELAQTFLKEATSYAPNVDLWAFGILLHELYFGSAPRTFVPGMNTVKHLRKLIDSPLKIRPALPHSCQMGIQIHDLILLLLQDDPTQQPTLERILAHPLFEGVSWERVARGRVDAKQGAATEVPAVKRARDECLGSSSPAFQLAAGDVAEPHAFLHDGKSYCRDRLEPLFKKVAFQPPLKIDLTLSDDLPSIRKEGSAAMAVPASALQVSASSSGASYGSESSASESLLHFNLASEVIKKTG